MRKCFIIIYEVTEPSRNYTKLREAIKSYGTWAKITETTWGIVTDYTATEIRDNLASYLEKNDRLFVIKSGHNAAWRNVIASSEWFKNHLNKI